MLHARDVVKSYADRQVLSGVSVSVAPGHRLGLVGENGAGKSTLLRLLAGTEDPDSGQVIRPADVGFLLQETPYTTAARVGTVIEDALPGCGNWNARSPMRPPRCPSGPGTTLWRPATPQCSRPQRSTRCGTPTAVQRWP
ncbi:MAG: ATP-binding cassette domain-containing protein [Pseudonocardiaceae bacterium]